MARSLKPTLSRELSVDSPDECPICFETTGGEILPLNHTRNTEHTASHRACASCRQMLKDRNEPCPWCRDGVVYRPGARAPPDGSLAERIEANPEPEEAIELPPGMKQCPGCGIIVQRISGDASMMCGCEARIAGGTLFKALRGGGCGHEWNWDSLEPLDYGAPGAPAHPRQTRYGRCAEVDVPRCEHGMRADEPCDMCPPPWAFAGGGGGGGGGGKCCTVM